MKTYRSLINNELISALAIYSVILCIKEISIAKVLLIIPFFSHKGTLEFLKSKNTSVRSLDEFIIKKPDYFTNFNDRFYSLLPLSINAVLLLIDMSLVEFIDDKIVINDNKVLDISENTLGKRGYSIIQGSKKMSNILRDDVKNLYLQLRVQL